MRIRPRAGRPSLLSLGFGLLAAGTVPVQSQGDRPLTGLWKFNVDLSDSALGDKIQDAFRPGAYSGGGGPGGSGPRGRRAGPDSKDADGADMMSSLRPVLQLLIRQDDSTMSMSDAGGQMIVYRTDGKKVKEMLLNGNEMETTARWKNGRFDVERKFQHSGSVKETYERDSASGKLVVIVRLSGGPMPRALEIRRVYDPATGG